MPRIVPVVAFVLVCFISILRESAGAEVRQKRYHAILHILDALQYVSGHPSTLYVQRLDKNLWQRRADRYTLFPIGQRSVGVHMRQRASWAGEM